MSYILMAYSKKIFSPLLQHEENVLVHLDTTAEEGNGNLIHRLYIKGN